MLLRRLFLFALCPLTLSAQLTTDQRIADFRNLADFYARRYAAIDWKKTAFHIDLLDLNPWLTRVNTAKSDLEFYDLMVEYVSDLQDAHDQYQLPSDFTAALGFSVDLYDGKALIDSRDGDLLPARYYPFQLGDELLTLDGKSPSEWIALLSKYVSGGNPRTVKRLAAELITNRYQAVYPFAAQVGDSATVEIARQSGTVQTYTIQWQKSGTAITQLGASAGPRTAPLTRSARPRSSSTPFYRQFLDRQRQFLLPGRINVVGFDELSPVFWLPSGFVQRLGTHTYDSYYSGTYKAADGTRIGFIRIPDFEYPSLTALDKEIAYMQTNTDALVVDVMRNPGGDVCIAEEILSRLSPNSFQGASAEVRVTWTDILDVNQALANAAYFGADADTIAQLQAMQTAYLDAYQNHQGRTGALPLCASTATRTPVANPYTKPVIVLTDEMSASSADIFAAMVQDNHIAPVFGYRTMGAGGSPDGEYVGVYSEGYTTISRSLVVRLQPLVTDDYPTSAYVENIGVRPDVLNDYMTADNLISHGAAFVQAFTDAAVARTKQ
jgi:hypothetical protein